MTDEDLPMSDTEISKLTELLVMETKAWMHTGNMMLMKRSFLRDFSNHFLNWLLDNWEHLLHCLPKPTLDYLLSVYRRLSEVLKTSEKEITLHTVRLHWFFLTMLGAALFLWNSMLVKCYKGAYKVYYDKVLVPHWMLGRQPKTDNDTLCRMREENKLTAFISYLKDEELTWCDVFDNVNIFCIDTYIIKYVTEFKVHKTIQASTQKQHTRRMQAYFHRILDVTIENKYLTTAADYSEETEKEEIVPSLSENLNELLDLTQSSNQSSQNYSYHTLHNSLLQLLDYKDIDATKTSESLNTQLSDDLSQFPITEQPSQSPELSIPSSQVSSKEVSEQSTKFLPNENSIPSEICDPGIANYLISQSHTTPYAIVRYQASTNPSTVKHSRVKKDSNPVTIVSAPTPLQLPDENQLNYSWTTGPVHSASYLVNGNMRYSGSGTATSATRTHTASDDEVHVVFGLTTSLAVDKNKLVSGRVQVFHASTVSVGGGRIQGQANTNPSVVSGRSLTFPCPTLTSAGSIEYKGTHLSDVAEAMKKVTMCNGKEGANPAPLSQTEDIQPVPLQYGHVLYSKLQDLRKDTFFPLPPISSAKEHYKGKRDGEYIPPPPTPREGGCRVLLSNKPGVFSEGERVPCPSRVVQSMQRVRHGRGFPLYHKNKAFIAEETVTPLDQLEVWSGLHHRNVLELSAVLGDCDGHPETSYQLTPVFTGDLKHLMGKCHLPSLRECLSSLFSDRVDLTLWNVKYILREILKGLEYLHSKRVEIVHGNLKLQNILVDVRCNCEGIFQCPHEGDSGYRVYISDFDQAVHIGKGEATKWDDMFSFGLLLMEVFGITKVDECTAVERECVGLEGLYDVVSACLELSLKEIPTPDELLKHSFFSLHPPGGVSDIAPPPLSPPDSCAVENSSPPLAVPAQQEHDEEGCKQVLGYKTPEQLAHLLTSKHSQSVFQHDLSQPDVVKVVHSKDSSPILNHSSSVSCVDSGSKDLVSVRPTPHNSQIMNKYPNNTSEERDTLMAELQAKQKAEKGIVTQSRSGAVVFSRCGDFPHGSSAPLPSKEAMSAFIGKGGNGIVSYVYHNGKEFAVKETCLRENELLTLSKLSHRNVMEISAVIEGERHERYHGGRACYQLMPRVTGDVKKMMEDRGMPTLCHYFFKFKTESDKASYVLGNAKFILREALSGLQYLHNIGVVHRDVKLQNILVDVCCNCEDIFQCPHEGDSGYRVYISDFDSVLDVERTRKRLERRSEMRLPVRYSVHGTPGYRPPEACYYCSSNEVVPSYLSTSQDIWSFGCTLMKFFVGSSGPSTQKELSSVKLSHCLQQQPGFVTGVQPSLRHLLTVGDKEMKKFLKVSLLEKYFPLATELHDITQGCLKVNPTQRPTVEEILKHPFFKISNS